MSLNTSLVQIHEAVKTMRQVWDVVGPSWTDAVRQQFVEQHWRPLEDQTLTVAKHMDRLSQLMIALRQELGHETQA
ncbi:MAG: hypothetical protein NZM31_07005 [Gemmatales bacterium]|nr:hypothetical protein [Gemmatales bacterium]MDW8386750.1 hypothetical protein [Gemmatales bacterium]